MDGSGDTSCVSTKFLTMESLKRTKNGLLKTLLVVRMKKRMKTKFLFYLVIEEL